MWEHWVGRVECEEKIDVNIFQKNVQKVLNQAGENGWELVSTCFENTSDPQWGGGSTGIYLFFKRPAQIKKPAT